jgi:hypothetical protein
LVNDKLKTLYVFLYDPRFLLEHLRWHAFKIERSDVEYDIERMRDIDAQAEQLINGVVTNLMKGDT